MDKQQMLHWAEEFLAAWNTQSVDAVLACYTADVRYRDPNTRGHVEGADAMRRYLVKLFAGWKMHWSLREAFMHEGGGSCSVLWHASIRRTAEGPAVELDGMDLVTMRRELIHRNEVYFDRALLAPLATGA